MSGLLGGKRTQINNTETAIGAVQVQNSAQGLPIPIVYGTTRITGNNIWYGDFTAVPHTDTQSSGGGKGGGGGVTTTNTTYTYTTGVAIGLCEGPISGIGQIWEQKNVTTAAALGLTEFTGTYAQAPWSYLTSNHPSEALGYRGIGYAATAAYQLGNSSSLPNLSFEMAGIGAASVSFSEANELLSGPTIGRDIAWDGTVWCAVGGTGISTSPDGITWSSQTFNSGDYNGGMGLYGVVSNGAGVLVAFGYDGGWNFAVAYSTDHGVSWHKPTAPAGTTGVWEAGAWNGSTFCITGCKTANTGGDGYRFTLTSADGITWALNTNVLPGTLPSRYLAICGATSGALSGKFVAIDYGDSGSGRVATSSDGIAWTEHAGAIGSSYSYVTIATDGDVVAAIAYNYTSLGAASYSLDGGATWTPFTMPITAYFEGPSLKWNGSVFCVVSYFSGNKIATSPDGMNWTAQSSTAAAVGQRVALAANPATHQFVAVGSGGNKAILIASELSYSDVNPEVVLNDILLNANYGAGFPSAQLGSLAAFSSYCDAAGIAISPAYTAQRTAMDIATELCQIGNSAPFWSEGMLKVTPYADAAVGAFTPDTTVQYQLTDDDFLGDPPVKVPRKRPADAYNSLVVQCKDRANNYNNATPSADDQASIDRYGPRPMPMITFDAICVPAIGRKVAQNILTRALYYLNTYEFTLGWKYSRLEPMDLVGLTDAAVGLNQTTVRILTVEEDEDGNLRMTAEDFNPGVSNSATYGTQASGGYIVNQAVAPGDANAPVIFQPSLALSGTAEVWLGTSGGANWGGAEVWLSSDNTTYTKFGTITAPARHGVLAAPLAAGADPDSVNTLAVDLTVSAGALITVPLAQADALITRCYVDGEVLAYETATLTSAYNYDLTYLRRGQYWSKSAAHSAGTKFMRLDDAVFKTVCPESWVGSTIYVKLLSFNKAGGGLQSLADVTPTTYVVQPVQVSTQNGFVYNTITANEDLYIPANTVYTVAGRLTNHGRITCVGRLRITN